MDVVRLMRDARMAGVRFEVAHGELRVEAAKRQKDWLDRLAPHKAELLAILKSNGNGHKNGQSPPPRIRPATDLANGERFAEHHGDAVRYCHEWGQWLTWTGRRFQPDATGEVSRLAKSTAKKILIEAANAPDDSCKTLTAHAHASQGRARLDAMLALAMSEPPIPITHQSLDADPWLLNFENGTVCLKTGALRSHDRGDLLTKSTGIDFAVTDEDPPLWLSFLGDIFNGDVELIRYLQRLLGSALPGVVHEHLLPILHGRGANGKSVFVSTVQAALGDYSMSAPSNLLMMRRGEAHPTELADLHGKRLVVVSETGDGQRLDEGLVKQLTGGDRIRARRMRQDFWEFTPSHSAMLVTNHRPIVRGTDHGIWRRLRLIPFEVVIPPARQDKSLPEKLRSELPAIAAWLVRGCLEWQRDGLQEPQQVLAATECYRTESDSVAMWFEERCERDPEGDVKAGSAYADYVAWCERSHERAITQNAFGRRLGDESYTRERNRYGYRYVGFRLLVSTSDEV